MVNIKATLGSFFKDEEAKFRIFTAVKFTLIPFGSFILLGSLIWGILTLNLLFIEAYGKHGTSQLREAFYDSVFLATSDILPWLGAFLICLVIGGLYMANMVLRPFQVIGRYSEDRTNQIETSYNPDFFEDLRLLSRFSDFFFLKLEKLRSGDESRPIEIPEMFTRIHKPVFEYNFFLQFLLFTLISTICATAIVQIVAVDIYDGMVNLSKETLKHDSAVTYFLRSQAYIWDAIVYSVVTLHTILYISFLNQLYQKVATPAFGFFATMRSFLKGNTGARVHLIGYSYVRTQSRKFNKFLDLAQAEFNRNIKKS